MTKKEHRSIELITETKCLKCGNVKKIEEELEGSDPHYYILGIDIEKDQILFCKKCEMNTVQKTVSVNYKEKEDAEEKQNPSTETNIDKE